MGKDTIERWLDPCTFKNESDFELGSEYGIDYGNGGWYSFGNGYGNGRGDGSGEGYFSLKGQCYGYGLGTCEYGHAGGKCISEFEGNIVYAIDRTPTCIESIHGDIAKGFVIRFNTFKVPCYVARVGSCLAHGETVRKAFRDAMEKSLRNDPIERRIARIAAKYPDPDKKILNKALFSIHNILTGSCEFGRRQFCEDHGIDIEHGKMTIREFIELTKSAYGREYIRLFAEKYGLNSREAVGLLVNDHRLI